MFQSLFAGLDNTATFDSNVPVSVVGISLSQVIDEWLNQENAPPPQQHTTIQKLGVQNTTRVAEDSLEI